MIRFAHASTLARLVCCGVFAGSPLAAIAADPPAPVSNSAESAVLKRIRENWSAREKRFESFYFAWDSKGVLPIDQGKAAALSHCESWFKGNAGKAWFRIHTTAGDAKLKPQSRTDEWQQAFGGATLQTLDGDGLVGTVEPSGGGLYWKARSRMSIEPLLFAMRPVSHFDLPSSKFRIVSDNAHVELRRCIKLRRDTGGYSFHCWVDPEREDVIAGWERLYGDTPVDFVSIEYKRENNEWLPTRWTHTIDMNPGKASTASVVTKSAINEKFSDKLFVLEFPPGAIVFDKKSRMGQNRNYVVQKDGTTRPLSAGQLRIYQTLEQTVDFVIDPEPLKDALDFIAQRYQIKVIIDPEATRKGLIDPSIDVSSKTSGIQLKRLLRLLLDQSPKPLTYKPRTGELLIVPASRPN
jgi:hypothetical protein